MNLRILYFGFMALCCVCQPEVSGAPPSIGRTVEQEVTIDRVRIDGSLNLNFSLGQLVLRAGETINLELVHQIALKHEALAVSKWSVSALSSFVVPSGLQAIRWKPFGGAELVFLAPPSDRAIREVAPGVRVCRLGIADWTISTARGWIWHYVGGLLVRAQGPNGSNLEFDSAGGQVREVRASRLGVATWHAHFEYDGLGRVTRMELADTTHEFIYDPVDGELSVWKAKRGSSPAITTHFRYVNGLISEMTMEGAEPLTFRWEELPGALRGDLNWPNPVRVVQTANYQYKYEVVRQGVRATLTPRAGGADRVLLLNPKTGVLEKFENKTLVQRILFGVRLGESSLGRITRVENGHGEPLERYEYTASGLIYRYWPGNVADDDFIEFSYDNRGRIIGASRRGMPWTP